MNCIARIRPFGAACLALIGLPVLAADVHLDYVVEMHVETVGADGAAVTTLVPADGVGPGDTLRYTITFRNDGTEVLAPGTVAIANPLPTVLEYLPGSATGPDTEISFSVDGGRTFGAADALSIVVEGGEVAAPASAYTTIRWVYGPALPPGGEGRVSFDARLE